MVVLFLIIFLNLPKNLKTMIWKFIKNKVDKGIDVYLITVAETIGSSPGRVGFKMAVAADNDLNGTIGGGIMEYQLVELARKELNSKSGKNFLKRQVHSHDAEEDKSGMICSGEQTQIFNHFSKENADEIVKIVELIDSNKPGKFVLTASGIEVYEGDAHFNRNSIEFQKSESSYRYSEPIGFKETVYIFGAGHISVPLSQILALLDFRVEVYDNRKDLSTFNQNVYAHKKVIVDYKNVSGLVPEGKNSYVVIMTFGHKFDEIVLKQFLNKDLKYIGMIGSKSKVGTIFQELVNEGFSQEQVARVCSPIGLPIGGQSAAEIAVSIAAQIVEWRNKR
ncbi:XdhC family protein [Tenuifilum thalassicum]|uniref:XdhC family protein n=2 Tax=Tenuifilum thalassicum TaxID=2590900 RepID=A0A7D3XEF8_9BACT|nr:XdhC family protein [Tenuifilum thalassicum]